MFTVFILIAPGLSFFNLENKLLYTNIGLSTKDFQNCNNFEKTNHSATQISYSGTQLTWNYSQLVSKPTCTQTNS